jgi:hypothetical protein
VVALLPEERKRIGKKDGTLAASPWWTSQFKQVVDTGSQQDAGAMMFNGAKADSQKRCDFFI